MLIATLSLYSVISPTCFAENFGAIIKGIPIKSMTLIIITLDNVDLVSIYLYLKLNIIKK